MLNRLHRWLNCADPASATDLIFVLAGLQTRKSYGLKLFQQKLAPQVLLSSGRFEVRRLAALNLRTNFDLLRMVDHVAPPKRHFFVSLTEQEIRVQRISRGNLGTLSEIQALAEWLHERPQITSLSIVSSGSHLRRLRICCRAILPARLRILFLPVPENTSLANREVSWFDKKAIRGLFSELIKIACYSALLPIDSKVRRSHPRLLEIVSPCIRAE